MPNDVASVRFDDLPMAETTNPPLTTVAQPIREMSETAVRLLMRLIQGEELDVNRVVLEAHLVIRGQHDMQSRFNHVSDQNSIKFAGSFFPASEI